jgi:two-component system, chemotaxis family, chemotaxis protein CheY
MLLYAKCDDMKSLLQRSTLFESKKSNVSVRTLIVEDNLTVRNVIKQRLEGVGCEVVAEAGNAFEGLNLFRSLQPDLVTLDLLMAQVSGIDAKILFRTIREESPDAAVIIISARPKAVERAAYLAEGAIAYFQKPFIDAHTLITTLKHSFPHLDTGTRKSSTRRF